MSNSATRFVYPFLGVIARGIGIPVEQAGLLVSARWAASLVTPAVTRSVATNGGHRRQIVFGLALFAFGAAVTASFGVFAGALIGFAAMGLAQPSFNVAGQSYLADRVPYGRRARSLGIFEMTWAGGLLIGAPVAGWLIALAGWTAPFWVFAALLATAAIAAWRLLEGRDAQPVAPAPLDWDRPAVAFVAVMALFAGAAELLFVVFGVWLEDAFELSIVALGGTSILIGVAELLGEGGTVALTDRLGKRRALTAGLLVAAAGYLLLVPGQNSFPLGIAGLAIGLAGFEFAILSSVPLQTELKPRARVQLLSWTVVAMGIARAAGAAAGPALFGAAGLTGNALAATALNVVAVALLVTLVREPDPPADVDQTA